MQEELFPRILSYKFYEEKMMLRILDQRALPHSWMWIDCLYASEVAEAIKIMAVRGAPAIAVTALFGMAMSIAKKDNPEKADAILRASRPTAVNLFLALKEMEAYWNDPEGALKCAYDALEKVNMTERAICEHGAKLLHGNVLTHCNTGPLATGGLGTALGAIIWAHKQGRVDHVWVDFTSPYNQGARLTSLELQHAGVPFKIIADNTAAVLFRQGRADCVAVGADRVAANGDFANKVGTYNLAVLCKHHRVEFYMMAPTTTIDSSIFSGDSITIEERSDKELLEINGQRIAPEGATGLYYAFDVTPWNLTTAIVTERGVYYPVDYDGYLQQSFLIDPPPRGMRNTPPAS